MRAVQPSCISTFFNGSLSILGPFFSEDLDGGIDWNHLFSGFPCDGLSWFLLPAGFDPIGPDRGAPLLPCGCFGTFIGL